MIHPRTPAAASTPLSGLHAGSLEPRHQVQHALDRAYRELVEDRPRDEMLRKLCQGLADALMLPMVLLLRRHEGGTLEVEAASRETLLWAELTRLPERWDGTVAGNGPASRALHRGEAVKVSIDDEGFMPWRQAAARDGIGGLHAWPLEPGGSGRVLVLCAARGAPEDPDDVAATWAAVGCGRLMTAIEDLERKRLLASGLVQAGNPAFVADVEGRIVWCNRAFCRLTGYAAEEVIGQNPRILSSGRHGTRHYRDLWNTIRRGQVWRGETVDRDRSGAAFTAIQTITPFGDDGRVTHYLAVYEDMTSQAAEAVRRELRSTRDPLTGLMHRAALEQAMADRLAQRESMALAMVDVRVVGARDDEMRNACLTEMQTRLADAVGADRAARMAAGEYLVQLPDDEAQADRVVEALRRELTQPYPPAGPSSRVELRIGRARFPVDGASIDALRLKAERMLGVEPLLPARRRLQN